MDMDIQAKGNFNQMDFFDRRIIQSFFFSFHQVVHRCHRRRRHHVKQPPNDSYALQSTFLAKDKQKSDQLYSFDVFFWLNRYILNKSKFDRFMLIKLSLQMNSTTIRNQTKVEQHFL